MVAGEESVCRGGNGDLYRKDLEESSERWGQTDRQEAEPVGPCRHW